MSYINLITLKFYLFREIIKCLLYVTDLINRIVQVLRGDLYWVRISARDTELIKPVKP